MAEEQSKVDLLTFYDDFVEFNDYCAFLCDGLSALFREYSKDEFENHTVQGVKRHCDNLKERADQLEHILNTLYQQSYNGKKITPLNPGYKK